MSAYIRYQPIVLGGGGGSTGVTSVGPFGTTPNADGGDITGTILTLEPADGTHPGGVSILSQSFGGDKTFNGLISAAGSIISTSYQIAGAGICTIEMPQGGATTYAFRMPDDAGTSGYALTSGGGSVAMTWSPFQAPGSYITALTGDGTATGPGSVPFTLATVNGNVGSFSPAAITVNGKGLITAASNAVTGNLTDVGTDGITIGSGTGAVLGTGTTISQHVADTTHNGYLSSTDWNTFNGKQAAGNYITALTGDVTASGPGSAAATLATVNGNVGSFTNANITVNAKGLITAAANGSSSSGTVTSVTFTGDGTVLSNTPSSAVTTTGTLTAALATAAKNTYLGGPLSGAAAVPTYKTFTAPTIQKFLSTGTTTGWLFTVTAATANAGDTYTNNGNTYTVLGTVSGGTQLFVSGVGTPAIGNLVRATGGGTNPILQSAFQALGTYSTPTNPAPLYLRVRMVGGGGGGSGSGTSVPAGFLGTISAFGVNTLVANGGTGADGTSAAPGGTASLGSGPIGIALTGGGGTGGGIDQTVTTASFAGGSGGSSAFGGEGGGGTYNQTGKSGAANTGGGGGGAGCAATASANNFAGQGGGSGGFVDAIITSPATAYVYTVAVSVSGGSAGTNGQAGGNGASGLVEVTEYYQ